MDDHQNHTGNRIVGAIILISVGVFFLLNRLGLPVFKNWWAIFILIPGISSIGTLVEELSSGNGFRALLASSIMGILFPFTIAGMFLFDLSWAKLWPVFVILAGFSMFLTAFVKRGEPVGNFADNFRPWLVTWGLAVILFGGMLLLQNFGTLPERFVSLRWWGVPILLAASGGVISAFFAMYVKKPVWIIGLHLFTALILAMPGLFALLGIRVDIVLPLLVIAIGLVIILTFSLRSKASN